MDDQNQVDKTEQQMKKAGKDIARGTKKMAGEALKKGIKMIIRAIGIKGLIITAIICIIVIIVPLLLYGVKKSVFDSISEITKSVTDDNTGNVKRITKKNGRKFEIDKDELYERVNSWFKNNNVSKKQIGLSEDLSALEEFMKAEVVTTYPDLRERDKVGTDVPEGELQGCIQFHRRYLDGTSQILEYTPYDEFALELAKLGILLDDKQTQTQIYFKKEEIENAYENLKTKFTLDDDDNLIIVNIVSDEKQIIYSDYAKEENNEDYQEYNSDIEVTRVNYQSVIQKYTMPFEFCMGLLMTSQNQKFAEAVAELAMESKIVIDVQDNITTNVTTEVYSFDVQFEMKRYIKYYTIVENAVSTEPGVMTNTPVSEYHPYPIEGKAEFKVEPYKTTINTLKNNDIKLCVRQAKTWIADYNSEYTNIVENPDIEDIISLEPDDGDFSEVPDYHGLVGTLEFGLPDKAVIVEDRGEVKEKKTNKRTVTTTKITSNKYIKSSSEVTESPEKFLSLLKVDPKTGIFDLENLRNNSKMIQYEEIERKEKSSPENSLLSAKEMLYEFLASNSKTVDLEDTMRYLFNVYEGKVKAKKTAEDFEIYEPEEFVFVEGAWNVLWKNNYTKEQFVQWVKNYTPPNGTGNGGRSYREYYEKHFIANAENYFDIATSYGLDPMFIFCIGIHESEYGTSNISYKKGNFWGWGAYDSTPYQSALSFVGDASKGIESVCKGIANNYVSPSGTWYSWIQSKGYKPETIEGVGARYASDSSWASRIKKYITTIFGISGDIVSNDIQIAGDTQTKIVQWAESQVGKSSFYNKSRGKSYVSKKYCAAFVKTAYNEAGLGYINGNAIDIPHPNAITYNSNGQVDYTKIPIGACIVSKGSNQAYGHVALYVGNGYVIEAGGRTIVKQKIDQSYGKTYGFLGWGYATTSQSI